MKRGFGKRKQTAAKPSKERRFAVARVKGVEDKQPEQYQWRLKKLAAKLTKCTVRAKKFGPGLTLGSFDEKAWLRKKVGAGWLQEKYCTSSSAYMGDIDNGKKIDGKKVMVKNPLSFTEVEKALDELGCSYMLHTTHSNEADWPHLRFVIPFAEDIEGDSDHIAAEFKKVHSHFNSIFKGRLDHRSNPAFMAFLPATTSKKLFKAAAVTDRPLYDAHNVPTVAETIELPDAKDLPKSSLVGIKSQSLKKLIKEGASAGDRSEALAEVYVRLEQENFTPAQIASVCWDRDNRISDKPWDNGYEWLRKDITRVLGKVATKRTELEKELFGRYTYVEQQKLYFDNEEEDGLDHEQFNNRFASRIGLKPGDTAHVRWQTHWEKCGGNRVSNLTYWPGKDRIVKFRTKLCLNRWRPAPDLVLHDKTVDDEDVAPWLNLVARIVPAENVRERLLNWMAYAAQHPGTKINHHPLLGGLHGIGKDTMFEPFLYSIGGGPIDSSGESPARPNIQIISNDDLDGQWTYHLQGQICVAQEIMEVYNGQRRALANQLKPWLATPPPTLKIKEKFGHPYYIPNTMLFVFFTNFANAMSIDQTERRYLAMWSNAEELPERSATHIWKWYQNGGLAKCARWLMDRDVSKFVPKAKAMRTLYQQTLAETGRPAHEQELSRLIAERKPPFNYDLVTSYVAAGFCNTVLHLQPSVSVGLVSPALQAARWKRLNNINTQVSGQRVTTSGIFAAPESVRKYEKLSTKDRLKAVNTYLTAIAGESKS